MNEKQIDIFQTYNSYYSFYSKLVEVAQRQVETLWHTTNIYLHPMIHEFAEQLTSKLPGDLKVTNTKVLYPYHSPHTHTRLFISLTVDLRLMI